MRQRATMRTTRKRKRLKQKRQEWLLSNGRKRRRSVLQLFLLGAIAAAPQVTVVQEQIPWRSAVAAEMMSNER